ncbi:hypothetical protein SynBMKMC1_02778 [Synechococcus sp. BMK-MC-1]|nr:hypothetical protein SynBMKMC1_00659 [Synechococcus sp. BMK-MC-1]QNI68820.1 hypothetical protein SynBMKMC1_02778 [Synechococcus sp. BMK-MC-1]
MWCYGYGLRGGLRPEAQLLNKESESLMCSGVLTSQEGAIPRCCKFLKRSRGRTANRS